MLDKDGNIVQNSRRDRIEKESSLAELVERYVENPLLTTLLDAFEAAINDPRNELVHLYEIREALQKRFHGEDSARAALGCSKKTWQKLGKLADSEPVRPGRHRGRFAGKLRDATKGELNAARDVASKLIGAYLRHLEKLPGRGGSNL